MASRNLPPGLASLRALANLISSAVDAVTAEYVNAKRDLPSLDSTSEERHPLLDDRPNLKLINAVKVVQAACAQLSASVGDPGQTLLNIVQQHTLSAALRLAADAGIADHLHDNPDGLSIDTLTSLTGADSMTLSAVMKALGSTHVFREVRPNVFANNRLSEFLRSSNDMKYTVSLMGCETLHASAYMYEAAMHSHKDSVHLNAFERAKGASLFQWLEKDPEAQGRMANFHRAMIGYDANSTPGSNLVTALPWNNLTSDQSGIVICDVGGSTGVSYLPVLRKYPSVRLVVQDLPHTVAAGTELWQTQLPEAIEGASPRVRFIPLNFFAGTPIEGCDYYYLRHVLHNWSDDNCVKILSAVVRSMKLTSRLLIHEFVSQHVSVGAAIQGADDAPESLASGLAKSPYPLLPNFGAGNLLQYKLDLTMIGTSNSYQRTFDQFCGITTKANLTFVTSWPQGEKTILEFKVLASAVNSVQT